MPNNTQIAEWLSLLTGLNWAPDPSPHYTDDTINAYQFNALDHLAQNGVLRIIKDKRYPDSINEKKLEAFAGNELARIGKLETSLERINELIPIDWTFNGRKLVALYPGVDEPTNESRCAISMLNALRDMGAVDYTPGVDIDRDSSYALFIHDVDVESLLHVEENETIKIIQDRCV